MQIDFHSPRVTNPVRRSRTPNIAIPVIYKRVVGLTLALVGLLLVLFSLSSFLVSRSVTPYALVFFEKYDSSKPQTRVHIVWVNEAKNTVQITTVPNSLEFHSQSLGTYPIESVYAAHTQIQQLNTDFLTDLSFYLRFPIRAYAQSNVSVNLSKLSISRYVLNACLSRQTSFSFGDCIHQILFFTSFSTTFRELTFPESALSVGSVETIQPLNRAKYREWSQAHFSESFQSWKKYTVAVLNGTNSSGLATTASGIVSDFGLSVLYIGESRSPLSAGEIVISPKIDQSEAVGEFLRATLRLPVRIDDTLPTQYRSDVVVLIGEKEKKFFEP